MLDEANQLPAVASEFNRHNLYRSFPLFLNVKLFFFIVRLVATGQDGHISNSNCRKQFKNRA